jgi:transposase
MGKILKEQRVTRDKLLSTVKALSPQTIAIEACGSANYWAREFARLNIGVKLIAPPYVKPFVKGNKNDKQDTRAIAEANLRPTMNFASPKTVEQQDMQSLLRIREGYISTRIKVCNQLRGLLAEYGIRINKTIGHLRQQLPTIFAVDANNGLSASMKQWVEMQYSLLLVLDENIACCDIDIRAIASTHETCKRLQCIEGIGELTAVAVVSLIGNGQAFKNGRHFAAFLGLVPKQHSSGEKQRLQGISKRDDEYVRQLLVHGGRSILRVVDKKHDAKSVWATRLKQERGYNKAAVAIANKNARVMLVMIKSGEHYHQAA